MLLGSTNEVALKTSSILAEASRFMVTIQGSQIVDSQSLAKAQKK
jgi:hypothetical protein